LLAYFAEAVLDLFGALLEDHARLNLEVGVEAEDVADFVDVSLRHQTDEVPLQLQEELRQVQILFDLGGLRKGLDDRIILVGIQSRRVVGDGPLDNTIEPLRRASLHLAEGLNHVDALVQAHREDALLQLLLNPFFNFFSEVLVEA